MPLTLPLPLELIVALVVVKFPSVTVPEPVMKTSTDCVDSPVLTSTPPLSPESISAVVAVKLPRTTAPEPALNTNAPWVA